MLKYIKALWIFKDLGVLLYQKNDIIEVDDIILAGIMGALFTAVKSTFSESVKTITLDNSQLQLISKKIIRGEEEATVIFMGLYPIKKYTLKIFQLTKEKKGFRELYAVMKNFFLQYSEDEILDWDHDARKFDGFLRINSQDRKDIRLNRT